MAILLLVSTGRAVAQIHNRDSINNRIHNISLNLPASAIVTAYGYAARQNILSAVNNDIFFGYWSVCADGIGFGRGNTYPSLDGHQMTDALLWLGQVEVVKANWVHVKKFQRPDGQLPLAIFPSLAGQEIGPPGFRTRVDSNGGLYKHWVPGDPLRALSSTTYIQNADVIYRYTQDPNWLREHLSSVNKAADFLVSLTTPEGKVHGAGYYLERPARVEYDGVTQCHAVDAFRKVAALNSCTGNTQASNRYQALADRIEKYFQTHFWVKDHFAEYIHPQRGLIDKNGLTDTNWSALALAVASKDQIAILWPHLKNEPLFYYGSVPTGIATHPERYEDWEFTHNDKMDLAAMGRVWYLEAQARARMRDSIGLLKSIQLVCKLGRDNGYYWRERYRPDDAHGAEKYCEYPANLIRIIQRFLFGVDFNLSGALSISPVVPDDFWQAGFGQTLSWSKNTLSYLLRHDGMQADYSGPNTQELRVKLKKTFPKKDIRVQINDRDIEFHVEDEQIIFSIPPAKAEKPCHVEISV